MAQSRARPYSTWSDAGCQTDASFAIRPWYDATDEIGDDEVRELLQRAAAREALSGEAG